MKPSVLVTGGAGYIGSHAVLALRQAGHAVCVIDNLSTGFRWAVPADVPFYGGDVADAGLVERIVGEQGVRAIMHFAGSIVVPESIGDPLKYYGNNTVRTRALIESAVRMRVPHFIFSSTAAVYGVPDLPGPVAESAPARPINPYGSSKLMSEIMLADVSAAHAINYAALRYFNVAGADPGGRTGQSFAGATHLIKVACEAAAGRRACVNVFGSDFETPDGTGVRDYIHVADLARAHVAALDALVAEPARSFTLNAGYGRGFSVLDVLGAVERVAGVRVARTMAARRAGDPASLVADNRAILAALDWRPERDDLDTIVADALTWERGLAGREAKAA